MSDQSSVPSYVSAYAPVDGAQYSSPVINIPKPPRLHWGWVLVLNAVTRGLFGVVWLIVQANWVRKMRGKSRAFTLSIVHTCMFPAVFITAIALGIVIGLTGASQETQADAIRIFVGFVVLAIAVLYLGTVFTLRSELESTEIGIPLGGVMTFFFGTIYFQYHLRDYVVDTHGGVAGNSSQLGLGLSAPVAPIIRETNSSNVEIAGKEIDSSHS